MARTSSKHVPAAPIGIDELAAHVADVSGELAALAGRAGWPQLTFLLHLVRIEAQARLTSNEHLEHSGETPPGD